MSPPDPSTASGWAVAFIASLMAIGNWLKNRKREVKSEAEKELVSDAKAFEARCEILRKLADDNLELYVKEHADHAKTREYWHTKASEFQVTLAGCQEKLAEMKSRPDYSDIVEFIKQQAITSVEILKGIKDILTLISQKHV